MGLSGLLVMAFFLPTQTKEIVQVIFSTSHTLNDIRPLFTSVTNDAPSPQEEIEDELINKKPFSQIETAAKIIIDVVTPKKKDIVTQNNNTLTTANIIDATNKERITAGLLPLTPNEKLSASAKIKTDDMITKEYFEHVSPTGVTVSDLGNIVGYNYVVMGENLALGNFSGADDLVTAWMNSPGHRANILNESYIEIGIYAAQGEYQGRKVWFTVQHFGTARGACPVINQTLKNDIDDINRSLRIKEKQIITVRAELEATPDKNSKEYNTAVTAFNILVATYNEDLSTSKQSVNIYNKQVVSFNTCLAKYQQKKEE